MGGAHDLRRVLKRSRRRAAVAAPVDARERSLWRRSDQMRRAVTIPQFSDIPVLAPAEPFGGAGAGYVVDAGLVSVYASSLAASRIGENRCICALVLRDTREQ